MPDDPPPHDGPTAVGDDFSENLTLASEARFSPGALPNLSAPGSATLPPSPQHPTRGGDDAFDGGATPDRIEGYVVIRPIASGGMGTVYEAEQLNPKRKVALKVVKPGMATRELLRRFEFEAQVLGHLHHPGIAQIFEAGTFDSGRGPQPFFAMEYVEGEPLGDHLLTHDRLTIRQKLELIAEICDAVEHAHRKGIIHRDLKPGNILVTRDGKPKILDFGLARATGAEAPQSGASMHTEAGRLLGTILYMSPEQAEGRADEVDTLSDVYSLGVIAYEVLAGRIPYEIEEMTMVPMLMAILEQEPKPISVHDKRLRGDVETILARGLEKEKERRYPSAAELAEDIRRHLRDEPILACPPSTMYRFRKFARRNRALFAGICGIAAALVAGLATTLWQARQARIARDRAESALQLAESARDLARRRGEELHASGEELRKLLHVQRMNAAVEAWKDAEFPRLEATLREMIPEPGAPDLRRFEWFHLWGEATRELLRPRFTYAPPELKGQVRVAFSPDGSLMAAANGSPLRPATPGAVHLLDPVTGAVVRVIGVQPSGILALDFSPDGSRVLTGGQDKVARVWDVATGEELLTLEGHAGWVMSAGFSPDGRVIATGGGVLTMDRPAELFVWDAKSGKRLRKLDLEGDFGSTLNLAFDPAGDRMLSSLQTVKGLSATYGTVIEWSLSKGEEVARFGGKDRVNSEAMSLAVLPGWKTLAAGGQSKRIKIWDMEANRNDLTLPGHTDWVMGLALSPDGSLLVSGSGNPVALAGSDGELLFWDPTGWKLVGTPRHVDRGVLSLAFSPADAPGGVTLALGSMDSRAEAWELVPRPDPLGFDPPPMRPLRMVSSRDGRYLGFATRDDPAVQERRVRVWNTAERRYEAELMVGPDDVYGLRFSPDAQTLVFATGKPENFQGPGLVRSWRWRGTEPPLEIRVKRGTPFDFAFTDDGARLIGAGSADHSVHVWNAATGEELGRQDDHRYPIGSICLSPDGSRVYSASFTYHTGFAQLSRPEEDVGELRAWDAATLEPIWRVDEHQDGIESLAVSPDGALLATGGRDRVVRLWNADTGAPEGRMEMRESLWVDSLIFLPDGETLVSGGSKPGELAFWDLDTRRLRASFPLSDGGLRDLVLSGDGRHLVAMLTNGKFATWSMVEAPVVEAGPGSGAAESAVRDAPSP